MLQFMESLRVEHDLATEQQQLQAWYSGSHNPGILPINGESHLYNVTELSWNLYNTIKEKQRKPQDFKRKP